MSAISVGDKWHAYSRAGGKKVYVGSFDSKRAALAAADDHAARHDYFLARGCNLRPVEDKSSMISIGSDQRL